MNKYLDSLHKKILASDFASQVSEDEILALVQAKELFNNVEYNTCTYVGACEHDKKQALDKIRAEIEEERKVENIPEDVEMWHYIRALDRALSIIDKYIEEDEE